MKRLYHEGIFYPSDKDELDKLLGNVTEEEEAKVLLLPHQSLKRCSALIQEGFRFAKGKDRVVILSPLHSGRIGDAFFAEGDVLPASNMVSLGLEKVEAYAEEEAGPEILVPFIEKYMPNALWSVVYADIRNAGESKRFSEFLKSINTPSTLFIISTNLSHLSATKEECIEWRERAKSALLSNNVPLLDSINRRQVSFCGGGIADSVQRVFKGKWRWIMDEDGDTTTAHSLLVKEEE